MKEIKAYTHPHRIADVVRALKSRNHAAPRERLRCRNLTVVPVKVLFFVVTPAPSMPGETLFRPPR